LDGVSGRSSSEKEWGEGSVVVVGSNPSKQRLRWPGSGREIAKSGQRVWDVKGRPLRFRYNLSMKNPNGAATWLNITPPRRPQGSCLGGRPCLCPKPVAKIKEFSNVRSSCFCRTHLFRFSARKAARSRAEECERYRVAGVGQAVFWFLYRRSSRRLFSEILSLLPERGPPALRHGGTGRS